MSVELQIGDLVFMSDGSHHRQGVVCGVCHRDYTGQPPQYRVAWEVVPPCPPELDPVGVWDRKYDAAELTRAPRV